VECYEIRTLSFLATEAPGPSPNLFHTPLAPAVASCYNTPLKKIFPAVALLLAISFRAFSQLPPVANNVAYSVAANTPLTVPTNSGVLTYDFDPNGLLITASLDDAPTNGTVALNADGSYTYTPNAGFMGYDYFTYSVSDTNLTSAAATVTLDVGNERWDGQFSPSSFGQEVDAISVAANGDVYAAGFISGGISRWDGHVWSKLGNRLLNGVNGSINALAWQNGTLIAGGSFSKAGGRPAENLAQWDGSAWSALPGGSVNGQVLALAVFGSFLYVSGQFTGVTNEPASNIAVWDGKNWSDLDGGVDGPVAAMVADTNGDIYIAGAFTNAGGLAINGIALWSGGSWLSLGSGVSGLIQSLLIQDGQLYVGGSFTNIVGIIATNIARWDGANWFALGNGAPGGPVDSLAFQDGQLYAGQSAPPGNFFWPGSSPPMERDELVRPAAKPQPLGRHRHLRPRFQKRHSLRRRFVHLRGHRRG
jgi:hypothetical protein